MSNRRDVFTSRWSNRHRLIATMLLSLLPVQAAFADAQGSTSRTATTRPAAASAMTALPAANAVTEIPLFGPKKYVRTTGAKDVYTVTVDVAAWLKSPFRLHVKNGEDDGTFRVSSATVEINGTTVLSQQDFNQNAAAYDRTVTLTPKTTLEVTLATCRRPTSPSGSTAHPRRKRRRC